MTAYGAADTTSSSTDSDIGFNASYSHVEESDTVTSGAATQSESHTLHVCDSEYNGEGNNRLVDVYIYRIRRKLKKMGHPGVRTVFGRGYILDSAG